MNAVNLNRSKKQEVSANILEIRKKIQDEKYLEGAIQRIAMILSRKLIEDNDFERNHLPAGSDAAAAENGSPRAGALHASRRRSGSVKGRGSSER